MTRYRERLFVENGIIIVTVLVVAATTTYALANAVAVAAPLPINDPILTYLQAAGFPAWAGVVAWGVVHITNEMRSFTQRLDAHIAQTNERLFAIEETILEGRKKP